MKLSKVVKILFTVMLYLSFANCSFANIATDAKLQYNKGIDFYNLGKLEEAANCFKNAVELDPNYIDAYYNLGSILEYLKQDEAALSVFKQIILRKPEDYEAAYKAADISKRLGDNEKAKMYLSIIPQDSIIGAKAKQLENSLSKNTAAKKTEESSSETAETHNVYNDISSPTGVTADAKGNIYVAGYSDNTIYKITPDNKKIVFIKSEKIDGPIGLAMDSDNNLYIANYNRNNVLKVDANGAMSELLSNVKKPYCLYTRGNLLFISSQGSNSVVQYKLH